MTKQGLFGDTKLQNLTFVNIVCMAKLARSSIGIHRIRGTLDCLHLDLWGPSWIESLVVASTFFP